jgi:hypothetical protein
MGVLLSSIVGGGLPLGTIIEGTEGMESVNPAVLPQGSFTTEASQPSLFPYLTTQPAWSTGIYSDIAVEDVPGSFGTSTEASKYWTRCYQVDIASELPPSLVMYRRGYNSASTAVRSWSVDGGATWSHVAATDYDGGTNLDKMPADVTNGSLYKNFSKGMAANKSSVSLAATNFTLHSSYQNPVRFPSVNSQGALSVQGAAGVVEIEVNALTEVNGQFFLVTRDGSNHACLYTHDNTTMNGDWTKVYTTTDTTNADWDSTGLRTCAFYYDEDTLTYYWVARVDSSPYGFKIRKSTDLISWAIIYTSATSTTTADYSNYTIVKHADSLVVYYRFNSDTYGQAFDENGAAGTAQQVNSAQTPTLTYADETNNALVYGTSSLNYVIDLGLNFGDVRNITRQVEGPNAVTPTPQFVDFHQTPSYCALLSYTPNSGHADSVLRFINEPPAQVKQVPDFGISHIGAYQYIQGE